ncbi:MAG: hypothetical protein ACXAEU_12100 [Candidatus Hodarchaeales archaeon]
MRSNIKELEDKRFKVFYTQLLYQKDTQSSVRFSKTMQNLEILQQLKQRTRRASNGQV